MTIDGEVYRVADMTRADFDRLRVQVSAENAESSCDGAQYPEQRFATAECAVVMLDIMHLDGPDAVDPFNIEAMVDMYVQFLKAVCQVYRSPGGPCCLRNMHQYLFYDTEHPLVHSWWRMVGLSDFMQRVFEGNDSFEYDISYGFDLAIKDGLLAIGFEDNEDLSDD